MARASPSNAPSRGASSTKPEPALRKAEAVPDREALGYFGWAEEHGLSPWSGGAGWWTWERPFVAWAEREGFAIDVAVSQDLETHPEVLDGHRLLLSVGHDEYWSWGMRDTVEAFLARGGQRRVLRREHLLVAGAVRGRLPYDGLFQVPGGR